MPCRTELANAIRVLSMDAVQRANSGHPGMPMGMADIAEVLWRDFLSHNPNNPDWINRDRFVLSNGHGSMLLYSLLHLTGYDVSMDDLKNFRQLHSKTPGHPEFGYTPGVETTTGPLGQGLANAVGMAIAERTLAAHFNRPEHAIIDHFTYVFAGDGCLMEGISHEACSLAGTLKLGKLIAFWDDNGISIDGKVAPWFADDTPARFRAYGWQVIADVDGHNPEQITTAIEAAKANTAQPTLICCRTHIGHGAPNAADSEKCHGAPLGEAEIEATRAHLGWSAAPFEIPAAIAEAWNQQPIGSQREQQWQILFDSYCEQHPELASELLRRLEGKAIEGADELWEHYIQETQQKAETVATRKASLQVLNAIAPQMPEFLGGSADLSGSNLTNWKGHVTITSDNADGNYLHYGVREFGMAAIMNGIALYGGFIPFGGTFLTFADYARNAIRLSAMMHQRVIYVFTHDSLALGEDGPTHQPVEHAAMLRLTPGVSVWRPCDATETAVAWQQAVAQDNKPTCLLLSRQGLAAQSRSTQTVANIKRGGYVLKDCNSTPEIILIATGSEVSLAMTAAEQLHEDGRAVRVVSMPSTDTFDAQDANYRESVLPAAVTTRLAIEAGAKDYWYKYVGLQGQIIGLDRFGESAPGNVVMEALGFNINNVVQSVEELIEGVYA